MQTAIERAGILLEAIVTVHPMPLGVGAKEKMTTTFRAHGSEMLEVAVPAKPPQSGS
ncbi:protein of unknown function [Hyphomicrobium sp. MC1]|nr:protein of unknown function [Hyphomicrobium sp. MC1]